MSTSAAPITLQNALSGSAMLWLHGPGLLLHLLSSQRPTFAKEHSSIITGTRKRFRHTPGCGKLLSHLSGSRSGMAAINKLRLQCALHSKHSSTTQTCVFQFASADVSCHAKAQLGNVFLGKLQTIKCGRRCCHALSIDTGENSAAAAILLPGQFCMCDLVLPASVCLEDLKATTSVFWAQ